MNDYSRSTFLQVVVTHGLPTPLNKSPPAKKKQRLVPLIIALCMWCYIIRTHVKFQKYSKPAILAREAHCVTE